MSAHAPRRNQPLPLPEPLPLNPPPRAPLRPASAPARPFARLSAARRRFRASALLALTLALVATPAGAHAQIRTPPAPTRDARPDPRVDSTLAILRAYRAEKNVPGISAAVAQGGKVLWAGGVGFANLQHRVPADSSTVYRIGSISKPIGAVAAMQLVEAGRLDLDAPIERYLPDLPAQLEPLTMRQILSHTAGIRHYNGDEFLSNRHYATQRDAMSIFDADSLLFPPGEKYSYSTYGYVVASAVIEAIAGEPYTRYVAEHVTRPLGLLALQPEFRDSIIPHHTSFYAHADGQIVNAPAVDLSNKWAGGGYVSTPQDLIRFGLAVAHGKLLRPETVKELWTVQRPRTGGSHYALGWVVTEDSAGRRVVSHTGGSVGGTSILLLYPDQDVAVSIIGNTGDVGYGRPAEAIARLFLPPMKPGASQSSPAAAPARPR